MPDHDYQVILNFANGQTVINQVDSPVIDLVTGAILITGGGGSGTAAISPDAGNMIEQRPNGLYVGGPRLSSENW